MDKIYTPNILKESLSAGWGPITYRQNTELQGTAWHWNPSGTWSDAAHQSGYFTGSSELKDFIRHSYGYPLPHRGNTLGDGRSRSKYSRITDGDPKTYWKSNPYLTSKFTGEDDSAHPQWIVMDLGVVEKIDTLRIDWADPYATSYEVQYWSGSAWDCTNSGRDITCTYLDGVLNPGDVAAPILVLTTVNDTAVGRSPKEVLRTAQALQSGGLCGADWKKGEKFVA